MKDQRSYLGKRIALVRSLAIGSVTFWLFGAGFSLQGQMAPFIPPAPPLLPPFTPVPPMIVQGYAPSNYAPSARNLSDGQLRRTIRDHLTSDSRLHKAGIRVDVRYGIAILTGTADTLQDYFQAAADAYAAGAQAVENRLRLRSY